MISAAIIVLAFDIGMGGWMILLHFSSFMPLPTDIRFFFLMQIGNILGFLTASPIVRILARRRALTTGPSQARASQDTDSIRLR